MKLFSLTIAALAAALACGVAHGEDAAVARTLEQRLEANARTIEALQRRIESLEQRDKDKAARASSVAAATAPAPVPANDTISERLGAVEQAMTQLETSAAAAPQGDAGLPIHGFADVGGGVRATGAANGASRGFKVGVFDLYMTPQVSPQVKALVEMAFEYGEDGAVAVDVERMQLGYAFDDALTVWAGRFHTPYGYWNTAFHHGAQLQTSITRPRFLDFEDGGGVLPAHSIGLWATGARRTALGKVGYDAYVVNGDRIDAGVLDFQALGDGDGSVSAGFRASLSPAGTALTLGVHGMQQQVAGGNADGTASGRVRMRMLGGFATYDTDDWEVLAEFYGFRDADASGGTGNHASTAWYAQAGYNIDEHFTPYARIERGVLNAADPYFALQDSGRSYRRAVAGVRYNLTPRSALKLEWTRDADDSAGGQDASSIAAQYSIRF